VAERAMKRLEDMSLGQRAMLTVAICIIILLALALFGYLSGGWDEAGAQGAPVAPSKYDDRIGELETQAIEEAFKQHIMKLYSIWVTDNYQPKFPPKAIVGARNARDAFIRSMDAIERREFPSGTK
jgi:hypothetical protein